ncbi:MAG: alkaline phosphatase family protein [Gemmatimonadetes bacterium]|nr:alkaline phosphatase family protein [Gemmatimonadota bacterium]
MKILVLGLDCAAPALLLGDEDLVHVRHLMGAGCWGRLESVTPPITVPAWMCMATSQDPGSLGVYGFRNRGDHSYGPMEPVTSRSFDALTVWDQVARQGGRSVLVGVPPSFPPRRINGVSVGCFLTPDTRTGVFTHPPELGERIRALVGDYPVDVKEFRTDDKERLRDEILAMSRTQFEVVRHLLREESWDYLQFVEIGLDRIHHGFWKHQDPSHPRHDPSSPWRDVVRDYYRHLDREIGSVLELLDEDTLVLLLSDHGARALEGGFCVNEWLVREGWLALEERPERVTPFAELRVDWSRTRAWSSGGYYARVFLNVRGREPEGTVDPAAYEAVRDELVRHLEATEGPDGRPLGTRAYRPEELYRSVEGVAPDLLVFFGDLAWRAVGGVGYPAVHVEENDTGPDDCNHSRHGAFVMAGPGPFPRGELEGVRLLDIAPTLLEAAGYDVPTSMQGTSFAGGEAAPRSPATDAAGDAVVRERLKGLGYIA